jgi:hypothetical protein
VCPDRRAAGALKRRDIEGTNPSLRYGLTNQFVSRGADCAAPPQHLQRFDRHPYPLRHRAGWKRGHYPFSTRIEVHVSCSFAVPHSAGGRRFPDAAGLNLMGGTDTLPTWQAIREYVPLTTRGGACEGFAKGIASAA